MSKPIWANQTIWTGMKLLVGLCTVAFVTMCTTIDESDQIQPKPEKPQAAQKRSEQRLERVEAISAETSEAELQLEIGLTPAQKMAAIVDPERSNFDQISGLFEIYLEQFDKRCLLRGKAPPHDMLVFTYNKLREDGFSESLDEVLDIAYRTVLKTQKRLRTLEKLDCAAIWSNYIQGRRNGRSRESAEEAAVVVSAMDSLRR